MVEATVTIKIDGQGRCYIPKAARSKLGIVDEEATAEVTVRVDENGR